MRKSSLIAAVAALALTPAALADDVADTLLRFVADYASDPSVTAEQSFGIRVGEDWYTVTASPGRAVESVSATSDQTSPVFCATITLRSISSAPASRSRSMS